MNTLYNHFEVLEDTRDIRGKKHELINIIIMTIYGVESLFKPKSK